MTVSGHWVGTPAYAAPEQRGGGNVGPAADQYALAGVLHFLLSGAPPGGGDPPESTGPGGSVQASRSDSAEGSRRGLDAVLAVVSAALAHHPADRFESCGSFVGAAHQALTDAAPVGNAPHRRTGDDPTVTSSRPAPWTAPDPTQATNEVPVGTVLEETAGRPRTGRRTAAVLLVLLGLGAVVLVGLLLGTRPDTDSSATPRADSPRSPSSSGPSPSNSRVATSRWPDLTRGDRGLAVRAAQLLLTDRGVDLAVDGRFGLSTQQSVERLQTLRGLDVTGRVDDQTWSELVSTLSRGQQSASVRAAQLLVRKQGQDLAVDGRYGEDTEDAMRGFQREHGLVTDGVVGPATWQELLRDV